MQTEGSEDDLSVSPAAAAPPPPPVLKVPKQRPCVVSKRIHLAVTKCLNEEEDVTVADVQGKSSVCQFSKSSLVTFVLLVQSKALMLIKLRL